VPIRLAVQRDATRTLMTSNGQIGPVKLMLFHDEGAASYGVASMQLMAFNESARRYTLQRNLSTLPVNEAIQIVPGNAVLRWTRSRDECLEFLFHHQWDGYEFGGVDAFVRHSVAWLYRTNIRAARALDPAMRIQVSRALFWPPMSHMTPEMLAEHQGGRGPDYLRNDLETTRTPTEQERFDVRSWRVERERELQQAAQRTAGRGIDYPYTFEQINGPCTACHSIYVSEGVCWDCRAHLLAPQWYVLPHASARQAMGRMLTGEERELERRLERTRANRVENARTISDRLRREQNRMIRDAMDD
jgi:hypothetical protein